jgi:hypothetical protein
VSIVSNIRNFLYFGERENFIRKTWLAAKSLMAEALDLPSSPFVLGFDQ